MPLEQENQQQTQADNPAPANDTRTEPAALQPSAQESSNFNSQQRDDIKSNTSQMVENGTLPELSLHNTANNGSIGVEGNKQSAQLKDGMEDKGTVRRGEGPYGVAERLLGKSASNSDVKALTGALRDQYRDETQNKDFMMNNLKVGHELLTDKNVDQVLSKIGDPEARQRIAGQLTKDSGKADPSEKDNKNENRDGARDKSTDNTKEGEKDKPEEKKPEEKNDKDPNSPEAKEGSIDRSQFDKELSNPDVMKAFAGRMKSEVGSQGAAAQLAFAEEVMNRAASRNQTLMQALSGNYYPTHNPGRSNNSDYHEAITKAWKEGTDTIQGATGNASGTVGFGAGKARYNENRELVAPNQTVSIGGERFGYEQVDLNRGWMKKYEQLKRGT